MLTVLYNPNLQIKTHFPTIYSSKLWGMASCVPLARATRLDKWKGKKEVRNNKGTHGTVSIPCINDVTGNNMKCQVQNFWETAVCQAKILNFAEFISFNYFSLYCRDNKSGHNLGLPHEVKVWEPPQLSTLTLSSSRGENCMGPIPCCHFQPCSQ